ncbi:beta-lactamase family protein [Pseudohalocynthiibacter aestuariivivens]|nr:serine hydrolase domain-containing protein [Pseudohalocynthiibacter aestuariivivens]QIE45022.1 beta-lactamase family protein [Pseudohalocynthiibacter aestuariivivens]
MNGQRIPNPDLAVGAGNKQRWNQPEFRRHGFHNVYRLFRRAYMVRARAQLMLKPDECRALAALPEVATLTTRPEFSALVCAQGDTVVMSRYAADFAPDQPHSMQSVSKLMIHLIAGRMIAEGLLDPAKPVEAYIPDIGTGYRGARVQDVLDMNVINDFSEDYADPHASCYTEEIALGWRLPPEGAPETGMGEFVRSVGGDDLTNHASAINYCSANTDLLTLICDHLRPGGLPAEIDAIAEAAGIAGALHISLSPDGLPAFSGGGCMTATDLARFGLLLARIAGPAPCPGWNQTFTQAVLTREAKTLSSPRDRVRYANQMMTNGRWIGHAGYGGQFLMVDTVTGLSCAYFSVLENEAGYCDDYMAETIACLEAVLTEYARQD